MFSGSRTTPTVDGDNVCTCGPLGDRYCISTKTRKPVWHKQIFYAHYTTNERSDGLVCMTMDGQVKWKTGEEPGFVRGGSILADGLLLATDGSTTLYLVEPDPSGFKPLASAVMLESGTNLAPVALVDGKLLVRPEEPEVPAGRSIDEERGGANPCA